MLHLSAMQELPRNRNQTPNTWSNTKLIWHLPKTDSTGGGAGRMTTPASRGTTWAVRSSLKRISPGSWLLVRMRAPMPFTRKF